MRLTNAEYNRRYRERHPERRKKSWRDYNSTEKRKENQRRYRAKNLEKVRESARRWGNKNYMLNGRTKTNEWEAKNIEQVKKNRRKWHLSFCYKLSEKEFLALLHEQQNRCAICESEFEKTPSVDHDHTTGRVRGLLCRICNSSLGGFRDDPRILTNAISYLCR